MDDKNINLDAFLDKEIPPWLADQLNIEGRIRHVLAKTTVSAVSTSQDTPPVVDPVQQKMLFMAPMN